MKNFFLLFAVVVLSGCGTPATLMLSQAVERGEIVLQDYPYAIIYDAKKASSIEMRLDRMLENHGFTVIGEKEVRGKKNLAKKKQSLGVRYKMKHAKQDGVLIGTLTTLSFEDVHTDKTLFSIELKYRWKIGSSEDKMWLKLSDALTEALLKNNITPPEKVEKLEV